MAKTAPGVSVESSGTQVMSTLSGKRALVTGASRGIGRASALALAAAGAQVLVHVKEADGVVSEMRFCAGGAMKRTSPPLLSRLPLLAQAV
jgi:NAD(P)-dependent dehydrogenase (short-subunit alcohol dehydrogenase family)